MDSFKNSSLIIIQINIYMIYKVNFYVLKIYNKIDI